MEQNDRYAFLYYREGEGEVLRYTTFVASSVYGELLTGMRSRETRHRWSGFFRFGQSSHCPSLPVASQILSPKLVATSLAKSNASFLSSDSKSSNRLF